MSPARPWLPAEACLSPRVVAVFDEALAAWSETWFRAGRFEVEKGAVENGALRPRTRRTLAPWGWLETPDGPSALAGLALDIALEGLDLRLRDQEAVETLETGMLKDLADRLTSSLPPADSTPDDAVRFTIHDAHGKRPLAILVRRSSIVGLARKRLPAPRAATPITASLRTALGATPVTLRAVVGEAALRLDEAGGLRPGDVVALNRTASTPIAIGAGVAFSPALSAEILNPGPAALLKLQPLVS